MRKKIIYFIYLLIFGYLIYLLQSTIFLNFKIFGVLPNLILIFLICVNIFTDRYIFFILAVLLGMLYDINFSSVLGVTSAAYILMGILNVYLSKIYYSNDKLIYILKTGILTITFNFIVYIIMLTLSLNNFEIINFIKISIIQAIYNIILTIILYPIIIKFGTKISEEYATENIFTRYF